MGVRPVAALRTARRAPRLVADVARQRRHRAPARHGEGRGDRPGPIDGRDLVPPYGQHALAAPLPRPRDHRTRSARGAAAGIHRNHRASGTARISRSPVHAPQSGIRAGPHVHVAVLHARVDLAAGCDHGAPGVDSSGASPARIVRHPDRNDLDVAARGGAGRAGAWRASQPAVAAPLQRCHHRASRKGSESHRHRRAPHHAAPRGMGALVRTGSGRPLRLGVLARAGLGDIWPSLYRRGDIRVVRHPCAGQQRAPGAGCGRAIVRVYWRRRRRDWIPSRLLDGWLAPPRLARRLRRLRCRRGRSAGSRRVASRHPARPRVVRLPRHIAYRARRCVVDPTGRRGGRNSR